jgi:superfamily II DNA or RNA helicase
MSFTDLTIMREYRSLLRDVVRDFYTPVLSQAVLYRRAVGFFSSSALISMTEGIKGLIQNNGTIEVIASPRLSPEDIAAIRDGFERRDEIILECLLRELEEPKGRFEEARLNLLSNLIASGAMTIKIALLESGNEVGMFHEKLGLMYDADGNCIAFTGSMNETANAFYLNYESIDVYTSWSGDSERVFDKQSAFTAMWNDYEPGISVSDFPEVSEAIIQRYRTSKSVDLSDLENSAEELPEPSEASDEPALNAPRIPEWVEMRKYQEDAISEWELQGFRGVFDMATGTGKTYTALAAICRLSEVLGHNLAVVIVCPYQHLVEQWKEDIVAFGMKPIVCYSSSPQKNWRARVKNSVAGFRANAVDRFCIVTTNATFETDFMREQIGKLRGNCLIVVDEAHNFGAEKAMSALPRHFDYRLALSATIERYGDESGTQALFDYFGKKCIEYSLEDAINNNMLTPYYYYPVLVHLDSEELAEYVELSKQISRAIASSPNKRREDLSDTAKMLLIKRARIVAGAHQKIPKLKSVMEPYRDKRHMLVYCGATTIQDAGYVEGVPTDNEVRQIDAVASVLNNDLHVKAHQFTSKESAADRENLKRAFSAGKQMQALVAIRCLDEGVNIPSIETAFILASSTNPKEYVQRRGRVLRKAEGKKFAVIYDFVTLPVPLEDVASYPAEVIESSKSLAAREMVRMKDFSQISENPAECLSQIAAIAEAFEITPEDEGDELYA